MVKLHPLRHRPDDALVVDPVRYRRLPVMPRRPVAGRVVRPLPDPARGGVTVILFDVISSGGLTRMVADDVVLRLTLDMAVLMVGSLREPRLFSAAALAVAIGNV